MAGLHIASLWFGFGDPATWKWLVGEFFSADPKTRALVTSTEFEVAAGIGFGIGIYRFFKGLRVYHRYRMIQDTPEIPIRSVAMGLAEVRGKAVGEAPIPSPISHTPCFFYKVDIERWHQDQKGQGGAWVHYKTDCSGARFHLEDATGKMLVDARGAELDVNETDKREVDSFVRYFPASVDDGDPVIDPGVQSMMDASDSEVLMYITRAAGKSGLVSGRYRTTEYCIEPEQWYDVTGTCTENPQAADEHDRNLIQKGQNESTFLISMHDKKEVESGLLGKAVRGVFWGGLLSVLCVWFLLIRLGWL